MYIKENGKTFWDNENGYYSRAHDENFDGMRFEHKRCPFCNRITSIATLHWLNHLNKCAPLKYTNSNLLELRYKTIDEIYFLIPDFNRKEKQ